jgi:signal transduction histidine kinase
MSSEEQQLFTRKSPGSKRAESTAPSVIRAAVAEAGREIWVREALQELRVESEADRLGVWLESPSLNGGGSLSAMAFRGDTWESDRGPGPEEWKRLSTEMQLPVKELLAGQSFEEILNGRLGEPILGPAAGMRHVLWVPVFGRTLLRGLLLLASQDARTPLSRGLAEHVAAELFLALELEEQSRMARDRKAGLELHGRVQAMLSKGAPPENIFRELVESCTRRESSGGAAIFSLIGERKTGQAVKSPAAARDEEGLEICALSGDAAWGHSVRCGPLEMFWRQAVETGRRTIAEPGALPLARDIAKIVALPISFHGATCGVLLAGIPRHGREIESLERLEQCAWLAAQVMQHRSQLAERAQVEIWREALLESSDQPVLLVDRFGFLRGMSRGARKILLVDSPPARQTRSELRFAELFRPREWERASRWLLTPAAGALVKDGKGVLRAELKDGRKLVSQPIDLPGTEFFALAIDVDSEETKERGVEEVEEELRQTVNWMDEGVAVFDEAGGIRAANERFQRMLGLTPEEAADLHTLEELLRKVSRNAADPEDFARRWRRLQDLEEEESQEELSMAWPVEQIIERCTRVIVGKNGRRLGRVEVYRETAARRMFQTRMVQTEKLASLGQRVSSIVHELSNPLTTVLGYAQRLLQHSSSGASPASCELYGIRAEAERAVGILRQALQLTRETRTTREPISLNEIVGRTAELMKAALSGSPIRLLVEKEASLPDIEGDFGQLQQVLLNLAQNAQQAIEQSGKGSLIGIRTAGTGDGRVRLEVWDDGPGIPGAIQARIFDPFFTTKPPGLGTGLGLAIVLGFVRQHGGTVHVLSPPKGGTRFFVELPAVSRANLEESLVPPSPSRPETKVWVGEGEASREERAPRVLVVEDEPTVGGLIADVLRDEGMRVDVLRDGPSALERAENESYDLVICDLKMPGMDGQGFFQSLGHRRNPLQGHVLFVTGDVVAPRTQEFLERHHLPYVAKPFRVEELSRAVREML